MMPIMQWLHSISGSYGWSVVLLTIIVKVSLMPLTMKSIRSSFEMQRLQPKMKEIQERFKDKPEVYNKKIMELYKDNKVNPLGGCLPILFQMPFFIALYATLMSQSFRSIATDSFFFITNLANTGFTNNSGTYYFDNIFLLIFFGVTTFLSQKMMITNPKDPLQRNMLYFMPVMITVSFTVIPVPAGVFLYLAVSNIITIGQNFIVIKQKKDLEEKLKEETEKEKENEKILAISLEKEEKEIVPSLVSTSKSKRAKKKRKKIEKNRG